ncbi:phosphomannose isomerase type I [Loa loa]|uniref:mannose-6-phosphate isomerase n=1 Tax=Loa loa TaxID=7209 RepID=A0A1I7VF62_LOALO|nr:phosphomannose isomerase type I [Loa loa]EFO27167.1 phosphomannose isomerase type I [Loa loa]
MEKLKCCVQTYAWGKKGMASEVARLYAMGNPDASIDDRTSYAELWMGTHPDGPCQIQRSQKKLSQHIAEYEAITHRKVSPERHLPFIMKLMSIQHNLSVQVHPTKEQAARLNDRDPVHYPDRNHKPELAYALTRFELLCGFRPADQICANFEAFPELKQLMGEDTAQAFEILAQARIDQECETLKSALAVCFKKFMKYAKDAADEVKLLLDSVLTKLICGIRGSLNEETVAVIQKMSRDFPGDIGCFVPLLLNHIILSPGECCYYGAQELHAYLSGECIECVSCSNNTIRAACTSKFIDIDTLCEVLNYRMTDPSYYIVSPAVLKNFPHIRVYDPDCEDFTLHEIKVPSSPSSATAKAPPVFIPSLECGSIMLVVEGEGTIESYYAKRERQKFLTVRRGDVIYIESRAQLCFLECTQDILAYRTFSYEEGPDHLVYNIDRTAVPESTRFTVRMKGHIKPLLMDDDAEVFDIENEIDGIC